MRVRQLGPTGDFLFGASLKNFLIDVPLTVGQVVGTRQTLWAGEWYLDTSVGFPYPQTVLGAFSQADADGAIQSYILDAPGVNDIAQYQSTLDPATRAYSAVATIDTVYGPTPVAIDNLSNF
jgi:hypothetical protein